MDTFSLFDGEERLRLSPGDGLQVSDALLLCVLSALAYGERDTVAAALPRLGVDLIARFDDGGTQAFAGATDRELIVSFRGTSERADWRSDLDIRRVSTPFGKVHRGFHAALDRVWSDIEPLIARERETRALWFTGHSLGGALAALAAGRCALERRWPVAGLHTFGQPRVGNRKFADHLHDALGNRYFRFMNNLDTVPGVLSSFAYRHAGQLIWFDTRGSLIMPTGIEGDDNGWVRTGTLSWSVGRGGDLFRVEKSYRDGKWQTDVDTIADHSIATCRRLLHTALINGHQPTRMTMQAARALGKASRAD
jgi:triacylglycerol lipase